MQPLYNQSSPAQFNNIRGTSKKLPKLINIPSHRVPTEQQSQSGQSSINQPLKAKIRKGYEMAQYTKAVQYLHSQSYVRKIIGIDGNPDYQPYEQCVDTQQLKHYGLGIYLYLQFVKRLAVTFIVMSAITVVPIIYVYTNGKGMQKYTQSYMITLARTSLGNLTEADTTAYLIFVTADILSMIVLFFFYLHWRSFHAQAVDDQAKDIKIVNPTNYVLSVIGFDPSTPNLQKNLITYYDQIFSGVYQVQVIYDYNGNFKKFVHYDELVQKKQKQKQIMTQTGKSNQDFLAIQKQIKQFEEQLSNIAQVFQPKQAIIHFRTLKAKYNYMNFCRRYSLIDKLSYNFKRFICCQHLPPQNQLFMGRNALMIKSNSLSRPQQINWQSLDISSCSRILRWIFSLLFLIISIVITTSLIAMCTLYVSSTSACSNFDPNTTQAAAIAKGSQAIYCFCSNHFTQIYTVYQQTCGSLSNTILYANLMQIGASFVSSISNYVLIVAIGLIAKYILKPDSKPKQYSFIFVSVLISNYINASVLPLVMNGDIFGFQSLTYLRFMDFIDFNNVAVFKDYNRDWFAIVAPYYMTFLIIAIISPIINLFTTCLWSSWTRWRIQSACQNNDKRDPLIQKQANLRISGDIFDLSVQQAIVILNFLIAIMYSSLIPILIPIITIYLCITFLCKKAVILRYSIRVPADHALSQKIITLMPFIILVHFLMGVWSYTADGFFGKNAYVVKLDLAFIGGQFDRVFKDLLMLGALVVILVWIIFDYTVLNFFGLLQQCCAKDQMDTPKQFATLQNMPYQQYIKKANVLKSYKLVNSPDYGHALKAYQELKKRRGKQAMRKTMRSIQASNQSPNKFGQNTMVSMDMRMNQQIPSQMNLNPQN